MRIVGGQLRGRRLEAGTDRAIRPTSDRAREALFNILAHNPQLGWPDRPPPPREARVLDVCAGTGALGLEALSRGAADVSFIEQDRSAVQLIRRNSKALGLDDLTIIQRDAARPGTAPHPFDLVLLDPPYQAGLVGPILTALRDFGWLAPTALIIAELPADLPMPPVDGLAPVLTRQHGAARLEFLRYGLTQ